jgi:hypothetical protein
VHRDLELLQINGEVIWGLKTHHMDAVRRPVQAFQHLERVSAIATQRNVIEHKTNDGSLIGH